MHVQIVAITKPTTVGGPEDVIVRAGRVCYRSANKGDPGKFIQARIAEGHDSILEHSSVTYEVRGISRACSHQLVRHRIASYSQESQRYVDMTDPEFVVPPAIAENGEAMATWIVHMRRVATVYEYFRGIGIHKEDARFVLPNATATTIVVTMNFRALRHFFETRISAAAQWEIRHLALEMLWNVFPYAPNVFGDLYAEFVTSDCGVRIERARRDDEK